MKYARRRRRKQLRWVKFLIRDEKRIEADRETFEGRVNLAAAALGFCLTSRIADFAARWPAGRSAGRLAACVRCIDRGSRTGVRKQKRNGQLDVWFLFVVSVPPLDNLLSRRHLAPLSQVRSSFLLFPYSLPQVRHWRFCIKQGSP